MRRSPWARPPAPGCAGWRGCGSTPSGAGFPLGTLLLLLWFERTPNETLRLLLITGLLGGLTTFSSYSAESLILLQRGQWARAAGHTLAQVAGSLVCAAAGFEIARCLLE